MAKARIINGKEIAARVLAEVKVEADRFTASAGRPPGLAVVLVGENPASAVYVRMKVKDCGICCIRSFSHRLPEHAATGEVLDLIDSLNGDSQVDGLLVQLPLPDGMDTNSVLDRIDPAKDVDGFHPVNVGRMVRGDSAVLKSCTPAGVMRMLDEAGVDPAGKRAVVIGRSDIVGKPMALLLLHRHATVTMCHSRTPDLDEIARKADILVAAVGRPLMVKKDWIREGAAVIDVGMNQVLRENAPEILMKDPGRVRDFEKKGYTLVGDVSPDAVEAAGWYTPVPGGVGPMTRAMLMANTVQAAGWRLGRGY
ncbi:bifunctional protein FolD protein [bacterium BMS3Abin14]|nr:bifunctional protein FolD protein [bacterium BMS3Abin14]